MRFLTLTSDNFVDSTVLMLQSLRVHHQDADVVVHALDTGWNASHAAKLAPFDVELRLITEHDPRHRGGADGKAIQNVHKMDIFLEQQQPFVFLDSDILVLRPLDALWQATVEQGWASVQEGTPLSAYYQGDITTVIKLRPDTLKGRSINTGVLGCDPAKHRDIFELGASWIPHITGIRSGDQGLVNLACCVKLGRVPDSFSNSYNGGWTSDDRIRIGNAIIHFARPNYPPAGRSKFADQQTVWQAWPRDLRLTPVTETAFWQATLPHPWPWLNHATQKQYRDAVARCRELSRTLDVSDGLVLDSPYHAWLLDPAVLADIEPWWHEHADRFSQLRHVPTYHLTDRGCTAPLRRRLQRAAWSVMARLR